MRQDDPTIAWVVNNKDPAHMGRVQIRINGVHDDVEDEHLPWAAPRMVRGFGELDIPPEGHPVYITTQDHGNGDPLYEGKPLASNPDANPPPPNDVATTESPMSVPDVFRGKKESGRDDVEDDYKYPDRQGCWDFVGNYIYRNQKTGEIQVATAAGTTVAIKSDGSVSVEVTGEGKARHNKAEGVAPIGGNPKIEFKVGGTTTLTIYPNGMKLECPSGVHRWGPV